MNRERHATSQRIPSPRRSNLVATSKCESRIVNSTNRTDAAKSFHHEATAMRATGVVLKKQGCNRNIADEESWIPFAADAVFQPKQKRLEKLSYELTDGNRSTPRFTRSKRAHRRSNSDDSKQPSVQRESSHSSRAENSLDAVSKRLHKSTSTITMSPIKKSHRQSCTGVESRIDNAEPSARHLLRCYSSSSSLDETLREKRRGRRPKRKTNHSKFEVDNNFNDSIRLDFDNDDDGDKQAGFGHGLLDQSFETCATASFRWGFGSSGILEGSTLDLNTEFFEEVRSPTIEQIPAKMLLYELAKQSQWEDVHQECLRNPWGAKFVGEEDGMTALHFAVMSRVNPYLRGDANAAERAPLSTIEALAKACPESASVRCADKKYTPLSYACLVTDDGYLMKDAAAIARTILEAAPYCALVLSEENYSCLDIHIISYSRIHKHKEEVVSSCGKSSVAVVRTLLELSPSLVLTRDYGQKVRGPIELLYRCNLKGFKLASGEDVRRNSGVAECTSKGSNLCDWWAWKWTTMMLRTLATLDNQAERIEDASFSVLHAAAQMVGCPVPIICLAIDAYPEQVKLRGEINGKLNCPLHEVCSWVTDSTHIDGDATLKRRKAKSILALLEAFPKAARMTNNYGETPLQLAVETCTPWEGGLSKLVTTFPKALMLPRSLEALPDDSPLAHAMMYHDDDLGSVGSNENEWVEESIVAVEGMYPFQIAAVLSRVPPRRLHHQSWHQSGPIGSKQLENRDMSSLTTIFCLLRARPQALGQYVKEEQERRAQRATAETVEDIEVSSLGSDDTHEFEDNLLKIEQR
jgi:hypothetical protein